jgi:hypothetical protein
VGGIGWIDFEAKNVLFFPKFGKAFYLACGYIVLRHPAEKSAPDAGMQKGDL